MKRPSLILIAPTIYPNCKPVSSPSAIEETYSRLKSKEWMKKSPFWFQNSIYSPWFRRNSTARRLLLGLLVIYPREMNERAYETSPSILYLSSQANERAKLSAECSFKQSQIYQILRRAGRKSASSARWRTDCLFKFRKRQPDQASE